MAKKYTLVIDLDRCSGCQSCEVACKQENDVTLGCYWNKVLTRGPSGAYPELEMYYLPTVCQACETPECVSVCPTGASYQREEDGIILIDKELCIGCQLCMTACPYGARTFNESSAVVEKCTLCSHLLSIDDKPACVKACPCNARLFGDINDPESDVSKAVEDAGSSGVHSLADVGNQPSVRYILHQEIAEWKET